MRWIVFIALVVISPVAFGGDLTHARAYLERSQAAAKARKRWSPSRGAIVGAVIGEAAYHPVAMAGGKFPKPFARGAGAYKSIVNHYHCEFGER
jgi:hypothetical protein